MIERICVECGKKFMVYPSILKRIKGGSFCSKKCSDTNNGNRLRSVRKSENNILKKNTHCEMFIATKRGIFTVLFDADDYSRVNNYTWHVNNQNYVRSLSFRGRNQAALLLHRFIMTPPDGFDIDHINHNVLDNRKCNLRICSKSQNQMNTAIRPHRKYKGVYNTKYGKFWVRVGKTYVGVYESEEEAALAYNQKAIELFGDFVIPNVIKENGFI